MKSQRKRVNIHFPLEVQGGDAKALSRDQVEQKMLSQLKSDINNGKYHDRLNDIATGYSMGCGVFVASAIQIVEGRFIEKIGKNPKMYLK